MNMESHSLVSVDGLRPSTDRDTRLAETGHCGRHRPQVVGKVLIAGLSSHGAVGAVPMKIDAVAGGDGPTFS